MAKHILCFLAMLIAARSSFSQDCTEATLMQKPGDWKEGFKGSTSGVSTADLAREKKCSYHVAYNDKIKVHTDGSERRISWWV